MDEAPESSPQWSLVPAGWSSPSPEVLSRAVELARLALSAQPPAPTLARTSPYGDGPEQPGGLLEDLFPRDPQQITATDVLAASIVARREISAQQARCLLHPTPERRAMLTSLRAVPLTDLYLSTPEHLVLMESLLIDVRIALRGGTFGGLDHAICARARPALFPIPSPELLFALGMPTDADHRSLWLVLRHVLQSEDVRVALAHRELEVRVGRGQVDISDSDLRLLETLLLTQHARSGQPPHMPTAESSLDHLVTMLVPSLANSLAEQFNIFQVMHHGTHEKQLSNVFAWLLRENGTHQLGDTFQRLFVEKVNRRLPDSSRLPESGYQVSQEVETTGGFGLPRDIADIVLTHNRARIVVENFEWSDGHGHSYEGYLAHGSRDDRQGVVVLLCVRHVSHLLRDGWENAVVVTYPEVLESLHEHVARDAAWRRAHPRQHFFIEELVQQYTEGPGVVSVEDQIRFLKAMCDTGESARYGHRPQEAAGQQFADLLALHAKRQFEEGRQTLSEVKKNLRRYAAATLAPQLDGTPVGPVVAVQTPFVGQWEWCVALRRADPQPDLFLEFGPTAVVENGRVPEPLLAPDYSRIFVTRKVAGDGEGIDRIIETSVGLDEVLIGLSADDHRLRDALLALSGS